MGECLIIRKGGGTGSSSYTLPVLNSSHPKDVTIIEAADGSATFNIEIATNGSPAEYVYQWCVNGTAISGANGATYTKSGLTSTGTYTVYCIVTNRAGSVRSRSATLTVQSALPEFNYTGLYSLINDGSYNWRIKFLTSGTLTFNSTKKTTAVDVFCVGGGGGGAADMGGGGAGGYTTTSKGITISANTPYSIVVGAGGNNWSGEGGASSGFGVSAAGGGGAGYHGGHGGSGGGGAGRGTDSDNPDMHVQSGVGGSNGGNGGAGFYGIGNGKGVTTKEFGTGDLYAGGGAGGQTYGTYGSGLDNVGGSGGGGATGSNGTANTGGGGGGRGGAGGSGIVVIRNKR